MAKYPNIAGHRGVDTSIEAAAQASGLSNQFRQLVHQTLFEQGDHTVDEVCSITGRPRYQIQPRFSELRKLGLIRDTGERRFNRSGSRAIVWRAVVLDKLESVA